VRYQRIDRSFDFFGPRVVKVTLSDVQGLVINSFPLSHVHSQKFIFDVKERGLLEHVGKREHLPKPLIHPLVVTPLGIHMPSSVRIAMHRRTKNERGLRDDNDVGEVNTHVCRDDLHVCIPRWAELPHMGRSTSREDDHRAACLRRQA
jgi:hypothetical protein